jgi:hypothetical protein
MPCLAARILHVKPLRLATFNDCWGGHLGSRGVPPSDTHKMTTRFDGTVVTNGNRSYLINYLKVKVKFSLCFN